MAQSITQLGLSTTHVLKTRNSEVAVISDSSITGTDSLTQLESIAEELARVVAQLNNQNIQLEQITGLTLTEE